MKCMKCGKPIDNLSYYCKDCRGDFYWPARIPEQEETKHNFLSRLIRHVKLQANDRITEYKQWILYSCVKYKQKKSERYQTSIKYDTKDQE